MLLTSAAIGGVAGMGSLAMAQGQDQAGSAIQIAIESELQKFTAPTGKNIAAEEGSAAQVEVSSVVGVASHRFHFALGDGDSAEKTAAVSIPPGAGFVVMLIDLQYAFVNQQGGNRLRERPLGELLADTGMRGNNLVCRVRLTDINADDPVSIGVTAGVLFFK